MVFPGSTWVGRRNRFTVTRQLPSLNIVNPFNPHRSPTLNLE